jgi:hypothetical protein
VVSWWCASSRRRLRGLRLRGGWVLPAFAEGGFDVADSRALDRDLDVVPGRAWSVGCGKGLAERVAPVGRVVSAAVAQVDSADECDVALGAVGVAQDDELLVVRATGTYPHVQQALAAGGFDLLAEVAVLALAELEAVQVRTPDQALDDHAALGSLAQHRADLTTRAAARVERLVRVTAPVGEQQQVARLLGAHRCEELGEVHGTVNQGTHQITC